MKTSPNVNPAKAMAESYQSYVCAEMVQHGITRSVWYRATSDFPAGVPIPAYAACVAEIKARQKAEKAQ